MNHQRNLYLAFIGICCGIVLSLAYVNTVTGQISLSEVALQLSGSNGTFALGISLTELLSYSAKLIPYFLFELYIGINLYRHYCAASVYVFSRNPNRVLWYVKECLAIIIAIMIYQGVLLLSTIVTAWFRHDLLWDVSGVKLLIIHALLYSFWLFAMTLLVNLFSIGFGSEIAFTIVFGGQAVLIVLLSSLRLLENNVKAYSFLLNINPISHLVIAWHSYTIKWTECLISEIDGSLSLAVSFVYIVLISIAVGVVGVIFVKKQDLLVADSEFGGI